MITPVIAAACGFWFSPPASWDALPLPPTAHVIEVRLSDLKGFCGPGGPRFEYGCAFPSIGLAYVSSPRGWPGTEACRLEVRRHEEAHLKGWTHPEGGR